MLINRPINQAQNLNDQSVVIQIDEAENFDEKEQEARPLLRDQFSYDALDSQSDVIVPIAEEKIFMQKITEDAEILGLTARELSLISATNQDFYAMYNGLLTEIPDVLYCRLISAYQDLLEEHLAIEAYKITRPVLWGLLVGAIIGLAVLISSIITLISSWAVTSLAVHLCLIAVAVFSIIIISPFIGKFALRLFDSYNERLDSMISPLTLEKLAVQFPGYEKFVVDLLDGYLRDIPKEELYALLNSSFETIVTKMIQQSELDNHNEFVEILSYRNCSLIQVTQPLLGNELDFDMIQQVAAAQEQKCCYVLCKDPNTQAYTLFFVNQEQNICLRLEGDLTRIIENANDLANNLNLEEGQFSVLPKEHLQVIQEDVNDHSPIPKPLFIEIESQQRLFRSRMTFFASDLDRVRADGKQARDFIGDRAIKDLMRRY